MKKLVAMLVALMATLFTVNVLAYTPPPSPAPVSWISDNSHVLSADAHARLDAKLRQINQSSANEIAALILPTLDGADIADVGDLTAKSWGVGKKGLDNGVLVVLAMKERKSRISTGKGVEGDLPDLKANDILQAARPYLRKGDVEGALGFIFDKSSSAIADHRAELAASKTGNSGSSRPSCQVSQPGSNHPSGWMLLLAAGGAIGLVWYLARSAARRRAEEEERERQLREERARVRQRQLAEREAQRKLDAEREREVRRKREEARLQQESEQKKAAPVVETPVIRPVAVPRPAPRPTASAAGVAASAAAAAAAAAIAAAEERDRKHRAEDARRKRERDEEDARRARERDEEDRRRRQREDDDRRSRESSSSSSSFDWGGSSGGSSGGFGGGDSGGGGSSSDW